MVDISKCASDGCPHKDNCRRKAASDRFLQSYVDFLAYEYTQSADEPCAWFVRTKQQTSLGESV